MAADDANIAGRPIVQMRRYSSVICFNGSVDGGSKWRPPTATTLAASNGLPASPKHRRWLLRAWRMLISTSMSSGGKRRMVCKSASGSSRRASRSIGAWPSGEHRLQAAAGGGSDLEFQRAGGEVFAPDRRGGRQPQLLEDAFLICEAVLPLSGILQGGHRATGSQPEPGCVDRPALSRFERDGGGTNEHKVHDERDLAPLATIVGDNRRVGHEVEVRVEGDRLIADVAIQQRQRDRLADGKRLLQRVHGHAQLDVARGGAEPGGQQFQNLG